MKKKSICALIKTIQDSIKNSRILYQTQIGDDTLEMLHLIKIKAQHMENRLYAYRGAIEKLGFRRKR